VNSRPRRPESPAIQRLVYRLRGNTVRPGHIQVRRHERNRVLLEVGDQRVGRRDAHAVRFGVLGHAMERTRMQ